LDRARALDAALSHVRAALDTLESMAQMSRDEATNAESKAEHKYDTRSTEASYLARGQAERVIALRRLLGSIDGAQVAPSDGPARVLSLVELDTERGTRWVLLVPDGGGARIDVDGAMLLLVSPQSPAGTALIGASEGESVTFARAEAEVCSVA
jgi:transcription elongation GreA/GreB family factor